jgi:hypothetical protein
MLGLIIHGDGVVVITDGITGVGIHGVGDDLITTIIIAGTIATQVTIMVAVVTGATTIGVIITGVIITGMDTITATTMAGGPEMVAETGTTVMEAVTEMETT